MRDLLNLLLVEARDVDLVGCGDDVAGVDATEGDAVDLEGAGDEEDTLVEGLQEDDALATEATSEQDQDGAGLEGLAGSPGADGLADLLRDKVVSLVCSSSRRCLLRGSCYSTLRVTYCRFPGHERWCFPLPLSRLAVCLFRQCASFPN